MAPRAQGRLERMFSAITFAEAGEFATAAQLVGAERHVLLALREDHLEERALGCALNLCRRVNAGLDILLVSTSDSLPARLARFFSELRASGIGYRLVRGEGSLGSEIMRYVRTCRSVAFVVVESLEQWGDSRGRDSWRALECPLVVAADHRGGVAA